MAEVPHEVLSELPQILSNLIAADNQIRANAEKAVNERLAQAPEAYLLALAAFARNADTEVMRTFSLVLLRRLLFRSMPAPASPTSPSSPNTLYDHLPESTRVALERQVLWCLTHENVESVRRKAADTCCDMATGSFERGRDWEGLRAWVAGAAVGGNPGQRESSFHILATVSTLMHDIPLPTLVEILHGGLTPVANPDTQYIQILHAALRATAAFLSSADAQTQAQSLSLLHTGLSLLPQLPLTELPRFIQVITSLGTSQPILFGSHLSDLLTFFTPLLLPTPADPTTARPSGADDGQLETPTAGASGAFTFPPTSSPGRNGHLPRLTPPPSSAGLPHKRTASASSGHSFHLSSQHNEEDGYDEPHIPEDKDEARKAVLEFMVSLSEARPGMIRRGGGGGGTLRSGGGVELGQAWVRAIVRGCLEGMAEIGGKTNLWADAEPNNDPTSDLYPTLFEHSLDRLALCLATSSYSSNSQQQSQQQSPVLQAAFAYIPAMLVSSDWKTRHAGLLGIACCAEGGRTEMGRESGKVVGFVLPLFADPHPRVRWAACQCIGQLCTDLEELIQEQHYDAIIKVLIPALEAREPRVHAHAASAIINFCETVNSECLTPYLEPLLTRLLHLLQTSPHTYVQEQAITTLAMVADASESAFRDYYSRIMPLLLNVLTNSELGGGLETENGRRLRCKAMECAGLIAIAVGRDVFRQDSKTFIESLSRIQARATELGDSELTRYLIATWAKLCQALGKEFEPFLTFVMPPLLHSAGLKADVSVVDSEDDSTNSRDGWETIEMDGQQIGIKTSIIEEKCQAFEMLVIHASTMGDKFAPFFAATLELTLPNLRFYFHDGVREACAMLLPMLLTCAKDTNQLTQEMFNAVFQQLITVIGQECDSSYLASLFKCFHDCSRVVEPSNIPANFVDALLKATQSQLQVMAQKRKNRANIGRKRLEEEREDLALIEEMEEFALEDMAKAIALFDKQHPLLVAISSVKELAVVTSGWGLDQ